MALDEAAAGTLLRTALYDEHKRLGARMVPFAGWEMPVQYASIVEEHNGRVTAASEVGEGTTITISLPPATVRTHLV